MATNCFHCFKCEKMTKHIGITFREFCALERGYGAVGNTVTLVADASGMSSTFETLTGIKCWKCCECGNATRRKLNGDVYEGEYGISLPSPDDVFNIINNMETEGKIVKWPPYKIKRQQ